MSGRTAGEALHGETPWLVAAHLFALCGFAVANPLLSILGSSPTFFVAHGASRATVIAFLASVLLLPPLLLWLLVLVVRRASPASGRIVMSAVVGLLASLTLVPASERLVELPTVAYFVAALVITVGGGLAYHRSDPVRWFVSFLVPAPLVFAAFFVFFSPSSALMGSSQGRDHPAGPPAEAIDVMLVVLDELPLGALLSVDGEIDATRYPGFARLAETSTWYPRATTIAPQTTDAIPALLTGRHPPGVWGDETAPIAANYPGNLFDVLAPSHVMHSLEWVTTMCPPARCDDLPRGSLPATAPSAPVGNMASDATIIFLHVVLPTAVAERWLPPLSGEWAGLRDRPAGPDEAALGHRPEDEGDGRRYVELTASLIDASDEPQLWFVHERLPHRPGEFLPDGTRYPRHLRYDWFSNQDPHAAIAVRQQFLLQLQYVDAMLERLLDRLENTGVLDDLLLIVTSDHGLTFEAPSHPRAYDTLDNRILSDVLLVPLFVKYPGQTSSEVDDRHAQLTDVLPTIIDVLQLPDGDPGPDGASLRADPPERDHLFWHPARELPLTDLDIDPTLLARDIDRALGPYDPENGYFAIGPLSGMIGQRIGRVPVASPRADATVDPVAPLAYEQVDASSGHLPALYEARTAGLTEGDWVIVSLNGSLAGTGPVIAEEDGTHRIEVLLVPDHFRPGTNTLEVYVPDASGDLAQIPRSD